MIAELMEYTLPIRERVRALGLTFWDSDPHSNLQISALIWNRVQILIKHLDALNPTLSETGLSPTARLSILRRLNASCVCDHRRARTWCGKRWECFAAGVWRVINDGDRLGGRDRQL
jgi:hypothetical protein